MLKSVYVNSFIFYINIESYFIYYPIYKLFSLNYSFVYNSEKYVL